VLGLVGCTLAITAGLIGVMLPDDDPLRATSAPTWLMTVTALVVPPIAGYVVARRAGGLALLGSLAGSALGFVVGGLDIFDRLFFQIRGSGFQSASWTGWAIWLLAGGWFLAAVLFSGVIGAIRRRPPQRQVRWPTAE
jgi:hypothetical protein